MADPALTDPGVRSFLTGVASASGGDAGGSQADIDAKYESWKKAGQPGSWLDWSGQSRGASPQGPASNVVPLPAKQGGDPVKEAVRQEWLAAGYPPAAVAGIMRRIGAESSWDTQSLGDYVDGQPTSISLYQHHADRAVKLARYLAENKVDPHDAVQMARATTRFSIDEMNGGDAIAARSKPAMMNPNISESEAYGIFTRSFERPAGSPGSAETNLAATAMSGFNASARTVLSQITGDIQKRSAEYDSALAEAKDLRTASRAALLKWQAESEHPPKDMRQNWEQWVGAAGALAMLGGMFGKNHTAAINAAGEMLQAANAADVRAFDIAYKTWKTHSDNGIKMVELLHGEARDIVDDARKSYDQKVTELATLSTAYALNQKLDPTSLDNVEKNLTIKKTRTEIADAQFRHDAVDRAVYAQEQDELKAHPEWKGEVPPWRHLEILNEAEKLGKGQGFKVSAGQNIKVTLPDGTVRTGGAVQIGKDWYWAGTDEKVEGKIDLMSRGQPKSPGAIAVAKFLEENPNASSAQIQQFNAEGIRLASLDRDFASGPDGRNLISLNTVADHLPLFRKYAAALNTGNTQAANAALNEIQRQLGRPDITNFDLARDFLADEVARVLVPGGAGALADREAMKERLKTSMSPAQLAGGADTATNFIKGKLEALRTQYMNGDPKREDFFNTKMLTPGAKELFDKSSSGGATDISKAGLDDLLKIIDQPGLTADQRRQIDERLKALGH